jgi:hypothetical protein
MDGACPQTVVRGAGRAAASSAVIMASRRPGTGRGPISISVSGAAADAARAIGDGRAGVAVRARPAAPAGQLAAVEDQPGPAARHPAVLDTGEPRRATADGAAPVERSRSRRVERAEGQRRRRAEGAGAWRPRRTGRGSARAVPRDGLVDVRRGLRVVRYRGRRRRGRRLRAGAGRQHRQRGGGGPQREAAHRAYVLGGDFAHGVSVPAPGAHAPVRCSGRRRRTRLRSADDSLLPASIRGLLRAPFLARRRPPGAPWRLRRMGHPRRLARPDLARFTGVFLILDPAFLPNPKERA